MNKHEVKTVNPYFQKVWDNTKSFEIRLNDRDYKEGDLITLKEYDPDTKEYSGRCIEAKIGYVVEYFEGLADDYVAFSIYVDKRISNE